MKLLIDIPDDQYEFIKLSDKNTFASVSSKECMLYAIKNGTPVSTKGDLISRSELKKKFGYTDEWYKSRTVAQEIDNAPTVSERPQGEWEESHTFSCGNILRMGMDVIEHKCKNCGRWSIEWVRAIPDNFCSNCGAEMRKGGTE